MMKKGSWNKTFKRRYFQLTADRRLLYYGRYDVVDGAPSDERGSADLKGAQRIEIVEGDVLQITTPSREWQFLCESKEARDSWLEALRQAISS